MKRPTDTTCLVLSRADVARFMAGAFIVGAALGLALNLTLTR